MKIKALLSLCLVAAFSAAAQQGYKDGVEFFKAEQYDNAKTILERTLNDASTNKSEAYYYLGQTELKLKNAAKAKTYFDQGIAANSANPYNYVGLGALDLMGGNLSAAEENFKKAEKLAGKDHAVLVSIARAYYDANPLANQKKIDEYLVKAHKKSKDQEPSIYILEGDMIIDKAVENPALVGDAVAKYEMAIRFDETNPEGYAKYADAYFRVDNPNAKRFAVEKFEEFLSKKPNSALAQRELAEKYYDYGQWTKAAEQYGRYIQNPNHFPGDEARYAVLLYANQEYNKSNDIANRILASDPKNFLMQRLLLLNNNALEDYPAAVTAGEAFFKNNPGGFFNSNDYVEYAKALTQTGADSLALVQYDLAVKADPKNSSLLKEVSATLNKARNYKKAAEVYGLYLASLEKPSVNDNFTGSGRWLNAAAKAETPEERAAYAENALKCVNAAIAEAEPNPDLYNRRARIYIVSNGNKPDENAVADFNTMISILDKDSKNIDPANPDNYLDEYKVALSFIGLYYETIGDTDAAKATGERYTQIQQLLTGNE